MRRLTIFGTGAILTTSLLAADPQWVEVTKAGANGETTVYADIASVKHLEGKTLVWFLTTGGAGDKYPYYTSKYPLGTNYKSSVVLQSFDCVKGRSASLQASYYSE